MATTQGACPNCGQDVCRFKTCVHRQTADVFDCPDCGRFTYTSKGIALPMVVPQV